MNKLVVIVIILMLIRMGMQAQIIVLQGMRVTKRKALLTIITVPCVGNP